ncbi:hypothetical protein JXB41_03975 [Candidatus Woesearchaeota archaeon]|nr:hypothetical protein [Candidatus Woesearchaeota archaeon]
MFIPKQLYEVVLIIPQKYTDKLLLSLGNEKIVQFKEFDERFHQIPSVDFPEIRTNEAVKALMKLDHIIDKLKISEGKPAKASKTPINEANELVDKIEIRYNKIEKSINENQSVFDELDLSVEFLKSIKKIKLKEENLFFLIETEDSVWNDLLKKIKKDNISFSMLKRRISGDKVLRLISIKQTNETKLSKLLNSFKIHSHKGTIKDIEAQIKTVLDSIREKIRTSKRQLEHLPKKYADEIYSLREQIQLELTIMENKRKFLYSEFTSLLNLWITKNDFKKFKECVKKVTNNNFVIYNQYPKIKDNPPTKLSNSLIFKPFEMLLQGFSLPGYRDIDPTFIIALFFPLFFGIMLSDVGYGLLLLILSLFLLVKKKSFKDFAQMLIICAIATIAIGFYFGSWFGFTFIEPQLNPLKKPIELIIISLGIGVFYVNLSLIIGLVQSLIKKDWNFLLHEILIWLIFEFGIIFLIYPKLFRGYTTLPLHIIFIIGPIIVRIFSKGILNILDFSKFFSTMISFVRISALAMSTTWISFAINLIYRLVKQFPKGIYIGIAVLIVGHLFNFAFNTFGSFLQAMRLHYVEFLGQFYQGKGHAMNLFSLEKKYTL